METIAKISDVLQKGLIEEALRDEEIPFVVIDLGIGSVFGGAGAQGYEVRVSPESAEAAKEALCGRGIICDVSDRMLKRTMDEVVVPLLDGSATNRERLLYLVAINNRETAAAIFDRTLEADGGAQLLREIFFEMADDRSDKMTVLAKKLSAHATSEFLGKIAADVSSGSKERRLALMGVVHQFVDPGFDPSILAASLEDEDEEIREAAEEADFNLKGRLR